MSTFVVRIMKVRAEAIQGQIEHVRSGEKSAFSSAEQLVGFMMAMNATDEGAGAGSDDPSRTDVPQSASTKRTRAT